jgi:hypothetical protein
VTLLFGCGTTQQEAARLRLNSARLRAAEVRVDVRRANPAIKVESVTVLPGRDGAAVAVRVRNLTASPTSDLPITVRADVPRGSVTLNGASGLDYFDTHLPAIAAHHELVWVLVTDRRIKPGAGVSATVGMRPASVPVPRLTALPRLDVIAAPGRQGGVRVTVRNPTSVPQYQLRVYGLARRAGRIVAAGQASLDHLGTHATETLSLTLLGRSTGANPGGGEQLSFEVPPTIFG